MRSIENATLDVVIPCFNEEAVIPVLLVKLRSFASALPCRTRFLFVNDGRSDLSVKSRYASGDTVAALERQMFNDIYLRRLR